MRCSLLFMRLAMQQLARRPVRSLLLALAVAVGSGGLFTASVLRRSIQASVSVSLDRMGADLMVAPSEATVHLAAALLTVDPDAHTLDAETMQKVAGLPGVERAAPQRYVAVPSPDGHGVEDWVVFDPARDFTVLPWLTEKLDRPFRRGDVIIGGRRPEEVGSVVTLFDKPLHVYGKLGLTGVGPFERASFVTGETANELPALAGVSDRASALLIHLKVGSTSEQFRFAAARMPQVQVVAGNGLHTSVRHAVATILSGARVFTLLLLAVTAVMVGALYSGLIAERKRELGLLVALGSQPARVVRLILAEAAFITGLGGVCGVIIGVAGAMLLERSLGFVFASHRIPFALPSLAELGLIALVSTALSSAVGLMGALVPAWRASRREPYGLIRGEGA